MNKGDPSGPLRRLSSRTTVFYKRIFPALLFAVIGGVWLAVFCAGASRGVMPFLPALIFPLVVIPILYFVFKYLIFDLADEVYDCGDYLLVRNRGSEQRVYFKDIKNIGYSIGVNPPRIVLSLRATGGDSIREIAFSPPRKRRFFGAFVKDPLIDELTDRMERARNIG